LGQPSLENLATLTDLFHLASCAPFGLVEMGQGQALPHPRNVFPNLRIFFEAPFDSAEEREWGLQVQGNFETVEAEL